MLTATAVAAFAAEDAANESHRSRELAYRRIFVPHDNLEVWPLGGKKYLPIDADRFESLVEPANQANQPPIASAAITAAAYSATLDGTSLVGRGTWAIDRRGEKSVLLKFSDEALQLFAPTWAADGAPARWGVWAPNDGAPSIRALEVPHSGTLEFAWRLSGRQYHDGIEIPLRLPPATLTRLVLDLPRGMRPELDGSVITPSAAPDDEIASHYAAEELREVPRRWTLAINPSQANLLRIVDTRRAASPETPLSSARESVVYQINQRGLDLLAAFELSPPLNESGTLSLSFPPSVRIVAAEVAGEPVPWQLSAGQAGAVTRAAIELSESDQQRPLRVVVRAWQALVLDRPWPLPRLRADGVFWTSGSIDVEIAPTLELGSLVTSSCRRRVAAATPESSDDHDVLSFDAYSPSASIEVVVGNKRPDITARQATALTVSDADITGRMITQLEVTRGSAYKLLADVSSAWDVEAIETVPADMLEAWRTRRQNGRQLLELQFVHAGQPDQPFSISVSGRFKRLGPIDSLTRNELGMLQWRGVKLEQHMLTMNMLEPHIVDSTSSLPTLDLTELPAKDQQLLGESSNRIVYDLHNAAADAAVRVAIKRGNYNAEIQVDATYGGAEVQHSYRLSCQPQGNPVEQLLLVFSEPLEEDLIWTVEPSGARVTAERLPAGDPRTAQFSRTHEVWQLRLRQPTMNPIELSAHAIRPANDRAAVPLLALPEANAQRARILVHSTVGQSPIIQTQALVPSPLSADPSPQRGDFRRTHTMAAYRYEPDQWQHSPRRPRLTLVAGSDQVAKNQPPAVIARWLDLESSYSPDGRSTHRAAYVFENHGTAQLTVRLEKNVRLLSATVNGIPADSRLSKTSLVTVRLPTAQRRVLMSLLLEESQPRLARGRALRPPLVTEAVPLLAGRWTIRLPEEFGIDGARELNESSRLNWSERLFGILGRQAGDHPFSPLQLLPVGVLAPAGELSNPRLPPGTSTEPADLLPTRVPADTSASASPGSPSIETSRSTQNNQTAAREPSLQDESPAPPPPGWRAFRVTLINGFPQPLVVTHRPATAAWALVMFFAAAACGRLLRRMSRAALIVSIAAAACLALLLPTLYAPLATGAALGLLCSPLLQSKSRPAASQQPASTGDRTTTVTALLLITVIAMTSSMANESTAAEPAVEDNAKDAPLPGGQQGPRGEMAIYRVLIPTDADRQPIGGKYYVSETFLRELLHSTASESTSPREWLLRGGQLNGTVDGASDASDMAKQNWTLSFNLEVLARDTRVKLPLRRNEAEWAETVSVDGIPARLHWSDDGTNCEFQVREPGQYEVVFSFLPRVQIAGGEHQVAITMPPLVDAKFTIRHPEVFPRLDLKGAAHQRPDEAAGEIRGFLDGSGRLIATWPQHESPTAGAGRAPVTELRWLQIDALGITLHWKLVAEGGRSRPDAVSLEFDPAWELVDGGTTASAGRRTGSTQSIEVPFHEHAAADDQFRWEANLRLRLANSTSLGQYRLPPLEVRSLHVASCRLALSTDDRLESEPLEGNEWSSVEADAFLAAWGETNLADSPQLTVTHLAPHETVSLAVRPKSTESRINEVLHVAAERSALRIQFQADVDPSETHRYQISLQVPPALVVEEVLMSHAGQPAPLRWVRLSSQQVNVFFDEPVSESYRLVLTGHVDKPPRADYALPRVTAVANQSAAQRVQLYCAETVAINVEGPAEETSADAELAELPPLAWSARLVGGYRLDQKTAELLRLNVVPNVQRAVGETLTTFTREADGWSATLDCQLTVEEGRLDTLRFRAPNTWAGPFEITPATYDVVVEPLGDRQAIVTLALPESVERGESVSFVVRGPLSPGTAAIAVPDIVPLVDGGWRHYLALPVAVDGEQLAWSRVGVEPGKLPEDLTLPQPDPESSQTFHVVAQPFRVALEAPAPDARTASVRLADTIAIEGVDGGRLTTTRFVVVPQGLVRASMRLPAGDELVSVKLAGTPALVRPLDERSWEVQLGPPRLPQILEIVTQRMRSNAPNEQFVELARPTLTADGKPLPVELSLWSVRRPAGGSRAAVSAASPQSAFDQTSLRLERLVSIAETAMPSAIESGQPDGRDWFRPWASQLSAARDSAQHLLDRTGLVGPPPQISLAAIEKIDATSNRITVWIEQGEELFSSNTSEPGRGHRRAAMVGPDAPINAARDLTAGQLGGDWFHFVADGGSDRLTIEFIPMAATPTQTRVVGVLAILAVAASAVWLTRQPIAADLLWQWPHAIGVLAGLAYWAWLSPSWLGLLIAAASLALLFRPTWPAARFTR